MDSVINRLRNTVSTVTSTVQSLSVVLPGNPVTREYEISQHIASGGPGLMWKIYAGYKKSTKQEAAIFVFEKKQLDKWSRRDRDLMIETVKRGVQQLTKLRHPKVLTVQNPLEESRDSLAFATEPVFASLANVLGHTENLPQSPPNPAIKDYKLDQIEIKYGLLQLCDGLIFLHNDVKMIHGNLCPESIIINEQGAWKIFGFDFAIPATISTSGSASFSCKEYESDGHPLGQQNLDYLAPEYSSSLSCSFASDMFSLGMILYAAFNEGEPLVKSNGNWHTHRQNLIKFNSLSEGALVCIPQEIRSFEKRLLSFTPSDRPDPHQFSKLEYFHDQGVKTLNYLDSLFQWDNLQKSKFYKGLSDILPNLPHRIRVHRVVPALSQEFVNPTMVPFVLPNVLKISEWSTNDEFTKYILPFLRPVMKFREPVQILLIFMKYMELLLQKTPAEITKSDVLPLIYGSLESNSTQVQELCLSIIPSFASLVDYPAMKNSLLPRIKKLCLTAPSLPVRVNCLICIGKILDHLDKWMVMDFVLPFLCEIQSREPAIIMGILGIYKLAISHKKLGLSKEIIATRVLPFLFPLSIENGLSLQQFGILMDFIHELVKLVETEQRTKLTELGAIQREQLKEEAAKNQMINELNSNSNTTRDFEDIFAQVGLNCSTGHEKNSMANSQSMPSMDSSTNRTDPINPSSSTTHREESRKPKPNDLTSTLINSNINQLNLRPNPPSQPISTFPTSQSFHSNLTLPNHSQMNQFQSFNPTLQQQQFRPNYMVGLTNNPMGGFSQAQMTLPNPPGAGMLQPMSQSGQPQRKEPSISLSKSDIEDFLK